MIIKSLFRRYERWNPIRPTIGAFWGIGVGIGCGVGWGPGFGPEVIGYVGAGCGVGFNVGITLLGAGIGFPANYIFTVPQSAFAITRGGVLDVAGSRNLLGTRHIRVGDGWGDVRSHKFDAQQSPRASFSGFKIDGLRENIRDLPDVKSMFVSNAKHIGDFLQGVGGCVFPGDRGLKS